MTFGHAPRALVVDASVAVEVADRNDWQQRWAGWQQDRVQLLAPPNLRLEVANALVRGGARAGPLVTADRIELLFATGIEIADRGLRGLLETVELADRHGLSVYDAAYLQLALEIDADMATLDRALARAAADEGLVVRD